MGVMENEDLVVKILLALPLNPHVYVKAGRVCKLWRSVCRRDESLLMNSIRMCEYLTKGTMIGLFALSSKEASRLSHETSWRRDGGVVYKYNPVSGYDALRIVGGVEGLCYRLSKRARFERSMVGVYGCDWREGWWSNNKRRMIC